MIPEKAAPGRRLMPRKREAIVRGARVVFARAGYSRASVETIAAEAGVSTRTIYNHFENKEQLFSTVLLESASQVADAFVERVDRTCDGVDVERDLVAIGHAVTMQSRDFPDHFEVVRQIGAEIGHFPPAVLDAWQDAGPLRVRREIARRLEGFAARGLLDVPDPMRAALHLVALATAEITNRSYVMVPLTPSQTTDTIRTGVRAFLHGYARQ
jgi:AcrR family transcriptional regulator